MLARLGVTCIVLFWAGMMSWLAWHDLWPAWTAQDPPASHSADLPERGMTCSQMGIFNTAGGRIGAAWTMQTRHGTTVIREDCLWIERINPLPRTRIEVESVYDAEGRLDEIVAHVRGWEVALELRGERFPRDYAFEVRLGHRPLHTFKIPLARAGAFGDTFRPFATLRGLHVGQTWRMQVFNPMAVVAGVGETFSPLLVRVTGTETLMHDSHPVECFVVEAGGARAWVSPDGVVHKQQVELPVGGTIILRDEPYDAEYYRSIRRLNLPPSEETAHGS
ncbi:MAG: hypothetical protein GY842_16790 [bacterium]|nr:hypothetical protein [bacterium]